MPRTGVSDENRFLLDLMAVGCDRLAWVNSMSVMNAFADGITLDKTNTHGVQCEIKNEERTVRSRSSAFDCQMWR